MLRITNGKVFDPANKINGVVKDICIHDGRVAKTAEGGRTSRIEHRQGRHPPLAQWDHVDQRGRRQRR